MTEKHDLQDIKKGWQDSDTADSYDEKRFTTLSGRISDALDKKAINKALSNINMNGRILDLPCGTGRIMYYLYQTGYKNITGADISEEMITVAKKRMQESNGISFIKTEAEHTEFPANTFSAITSIRFMGHIPKETRIEILREFSRLCDGPVIIEYSVRNPIARKVKSLLRALTVRARLPKQWKWHDVSREELKQELAEGGLQITRLIHKLPFLSESTFVVAKSVD